MSDTEIKRVIEMDNGVTDDEIAEIMAVTIRHHPDERTADEFIEEMIDRVEDEKKRAKRLVQPNLHRIEEMQATAFARGGKCVSIEYRGFDEKLTWECCNGHTWNANPRNVYNHKSWCPKCRGNVGEELVRAAMHECFPGKVFERVREPWLDGLELDGYNQELQLAFEYQGIQHFEHVAHFHREDGQFESQLARDAYKRDCCVRMGIKLMEIPYKIKLDHIRAAVRKMVSDLGFAIADATMSDDEFYNSCRANSHYNETRLNLAKKIAIVKGGRCLAMKYIRNDFKMDFICKDGHEFKASLQDINQPRSRGPRFCPTCGGTQKKSDDEIHERVDAIKYRLISIEMKFVGNKNRRWLTVQCPENHDLYGTTMENLISGDGSLNKGCMQCGRVKTGKSRRGDISKWSEKTGFTVIGEYLGGTKVSTWRCPKGHEFESTYVALKVRKNLCRVCLLSRA